MANGIKMSVKPIGDRDLKRFLTEMPKRVPKKANRAAVTAGTTPVVKAVRPLIIPVRSGTMKKSVTKKIKSYGPNALGLVGANKATIGEFEGRKAWPNKYWHLVNLGTQPHQQKRGPHPGAKANNALKYGFDRAKPQIASAMESKYREVLAKESAKLRS